MNLDRLLKFGLFPKELPPPFNSISFGDVCLRLPNKVAVKQNYISKPCIHNLARPGNQRRPLSILNPFNYYLIAKIISDNKSEVKSQLAKSKISISKPIEDPNDTRAYVLESDGRAVLKKRAKIRSGAKFVVRVDVARFYNSIYTHSIPWALVGKKFAKANRKGGFANDLDRSVQNSQDGQTLGIAVGPDTSFILSELIGASIDEMIQHKGFKGFRFVDDFEFCFSNRNDAEQSIPILESILQNYELALNPLKTYIDVLPIPVESPWRTKIKQFQTEPRISEGKLIEYFDLLFELNSRNPTEPVLRYGIARLRRTKIEDLDLLLDLLLQCIMIEPGTLKESMSLAGTLGMNIKGGRLKNIIHSLITDHGMMRHSSEVAWAIWTALHYRIKIPNAIANNLRDFEDSTIALLSLHAHHEGLMPKSVSKYWQHLMTSASLKDGHWLLAYEADVKGWLLSIDKVNHIDSDPNFKFLKQNGVSFYDDGNMDLEEIEIDDRYDSGSEDDEDDIEDSSDDDEVTF